MPFEYSLKGIEKVDDIERKHQVVKLIWEGKSETEILAILPPDTKLSTRWKELVELYKAGYQKMFDEINHAYILIKP